MNVTLGRITQADIKKLKADYDPGLIDALLTRAEDINFSEAYDNVLSMLLNRLPDNSRFDQLALERRTHEAALLKEEVYMFQELRKLLASINSRYGAITGVAPVDAGKGTS